MEASRRIQRCASLIVDKAAAEASVSRLWARRVALYGPYQRSLQLSNGDKNEGGCVVGDRVPPTKAALHLLLDKIGNLPNGAIKEAEEHLLLGENKQHGFDATQRRVFVGELLRLCRGEQARLAVPLVHSTSGNIGGPKKIMEILGDDAELHAVGNTAAVTSALATVSKMSPPPGCDTLRITVKGAGKYCFSTKASSDNSGEAMSFLESAVALANQAWKDAVHRMPRTDSTCSLLSTSTASGDLDGPTCHAQIDERKETEKASGLQPRLNVGLIGDVANGKSTLVHAMTGKRTQRHSLEQQKHGMTIRLGFANAAIFSCQDHALCGMHAFEAEEGDSPEDKSPLCNRCGGPMELARRVSFIDCPGHAELMATMLAGASAFDAVILAAAANTPCPSPQAKQHLEALKLSRAIARPGTVAIAQTKAELLVHEASKNPGLSGSERLARHADEARSALLTTAGAGAPFFPTCAPLGLGLEPLARWLANIEVNDHLADAGPHKLNVLRSFDVNHPGIDFESMVGGVLGGSITGSGSFHPGDLLEVRPGLVLTPKNKEMKHDANEEVELQPFSVCPLQCRCVALMTGTTSLEEAAAGGLVALRTTLCPSLCADDRLVGAVVGSKGTLPPIWGPTLLLDGLQFVETIETGQGSSKRSRPSDLLKKKSIIRCHSGSGTVRAYVVRVSTRRGKLEVRLDSPLCADEGSNIAIEAKAADRSGFYLVAHAHIFGGTCCHEGAESPHAAVDERQFPEGKLGSAAEKDEERRVLFLEEFSQQAAGGDNDTRIIVPRPILSRDGGAHILITNFAYIAASLRRETCHLQTYLEREGGLSCTQAGNGGSSLRIRWRGRDFPERINKIIRRYAVTFVTCHQCRSAKTELSKTATGSKTELLCRQCNARRFVAKL